MSKTNEISKTTSERIESVFDEFVVKKISDELNPIRSDLKRLNVAYQERSTRECIESICQSTGDIEASLSKIKSNISLQDPGWKLSEQIQILVDAQDDLKEEIDAQDTGWQERHESLIKHVDAECANIKSELADKIHALFTAEQTARSEQTERVLEQLAALMCITTQSGTDLQAALEDHDQKNTKTLLKTINDCSLKMIETADAGTSTLRASIENHTSKTIASVDKIGAEIQKTQVEDYEKVQEAIKTLTGVTKETSEHQDGHHAAIVKQIEAMEISNAQKLDEFLAVCKNENQRLKRMLYVSWAICGATLAAAIASIFIRLL